MWNAYQKGYKGWLQLERSLADNSVEAYLHDVDLFATYASMHLKGIPLKDITLQHLQEFLQSLSGEALGPRSQARIISGLRSFFKYCLIENIIEQNPTTLLTTPKLPQKLPDVLSLEEIESMLSKIDMSKKDGHRNRSIIETMYGCGLRVSELVNLRISNLFFEEGFIKVTGKGDKERLIPIGNSAIKEMNLYLQNQRNQQHIIAGEEDIVYLNLRGKRLSRVYIFTLIKSLAALAGIRKNISPHTFRHSFASHLVDGGADLRAVQEMLGHESITTTEIYTHLDKPYLRETVLLYHPAYKKRQEL